MLTAVHWNIENCCICTLNISYVLKFSNSFREIVNNLLPFLGEPSSDYNNRFSNIIIFIFTLKNNIRVYWYEYNVYVHNLMVMYISIFFFLVVIIFITLRKYLYIGIYIFHLIIKYFNGVTKYVRVYPLIYLPIHRCLYWYNR